MSARSRPTMATSESRRETRDTSRPDSLEGLELRLVDGYHRIDSARASGQDVTAWEDFWIDLLHRYESLCDEVRVAA